MMKLNMCGSFLKELVQKLYGVPDIDGNIDCNEDKYMLWWFFAGDGSWHEDMTVFYRMQQRDNVKMGMLYLGQESDIYHVLWLE